jgi:hypothetical protein
VSEVVLLVLAVFVLGLLAGAGAVLTYRLSTVVSIRVRGAGTLDAAVVWLDYAWHVVGGSHFGMYDLYPHVTWRSKKAAVGYVALTAHYAEVEALYMRGFTDAGTQSKKADLLRRIQRYVGRYALSFTHAKEESWQHNSNQ